jgi:hypothetical protein
LLFGWFDGERFDEVAEGNLVFRFGESAEEEFYVGDIYSG